MLNSNSFNVVLNSLYTEMESFMCKTVNNCVISVWRDLSVETIGKSAEIYTSYPQIFRMRNNVIG